MHKKTSYEQLYHQLIAGELKQISTMGIVPFNGWEDFIEHEDLINKLSDCPFLIKPRFKEDRQTKQLLCTAKYLEDQKTYEISFGIYDFDEEIEALQQFFPLLDNEYAELKKATQVLICEMFFEGKIMESYLFQLKLLDYLVPEAVAIRDYSCGKLISHAWLKMTLDDQILPKYQCLYSVHGVIDEDDQTLWIHTHGLLRCGLIEVEMLGVPHDTTHHYHGIIDTIVGLMLKDGVPHFNEALTVGYCHETYLIYAWLPWQKAITLFSKENADHFLGDANDRKDEAHSEPGGVFLPFVEEIFCETEFYEDLISKHPLVLFISIEETKRMSQLAQQRYPYLQKIFTQHGQEEEIWRFIAKIAFEIDPKFCTEGKENHEHIWVKITATNQTELKGTLLEKAYYISDLDAEVEVTVPIARITDWMIDSKEINYRLNPELIYLYYQKN